MNGILNHLWQSTAFAAIVALAAWALRRNSARARYWLWLAASLKFLVPFAWIVSTGARVQLPPDTPSLRALTVNLLRAGSSAAGSSGENYLRVDARAGRGVVRRSAFISDSTAPAMADHPPRGARGPSGYLAIIGFPCSRLMRP